MKLFCLNFKLISNRIKFSLNATLRSDSPPPGISLKNLERRKFLLRIKTQLNPNLGDTSAEAGVSVGLLEEVFDKGGGALRCHKVFTSLIVSVAFHLVRFNETIAAMRSEDVRYW